MLKFSFIPIVFSLLTQNVSGQVQNKLDLQHQVRMKANDGAATGITYSVIPATVKLAGGRTEEGRFIVLTDVAQKLYWWRFQGGKGLEDPAADAANFSKTCGTLRGNGDFLVVCTTDRRIMIAVVKRAFTNESELPRLVEEEFNSRATHLDTGFDYFDKTLNLWPTLGPDFFVNPGRADSIRKLHLRSIERSPQGWDIALGGAGGRFVSLSLSQSLNLLGWKALPNETPQRP